MPNPNFSSRVHYLHVKQSDALSAAIEQGLARLIPFRDRISHCDVQVQHWMLHHDLGSSYRVGLELERRAGASPVRVDCESASNPEPTVLPELVHEAFQRAVRRLSASAQQAASEPVATLSPDARRLHPLHSLAPAELQFDGDDE